MEQLSAPGIQVPAVCETIDLQAFCLASKVDLTTAVELEDNSMDKKEVRGLCTESEYLG